MTLRKPASKLTAFAFALAGVFGLATLAGAVAGPDREGASAREEAGSEHGMEGEAAAVDPVRGLAVSDGGLTLALEDTDFEPGRAGELRFRILESDGAPVRDFDVEHERRMHLIVVRRDLSAFRHVHPRQAGDGAWEVPLRLPQAGSYRVFADFSSSGESHTLGADLHVDGRFEARELPHPAPTARADGGLEVRLEQAGGQARFTVFEDGRRVRDIEPYLGARGHLVALREGDLAFLHVHPQSEATEGADIRFALEYPSRGRYRLFLQFKLDGRVHTAAFTREIGDGHGH